MKNEIIKRRPTAKRLFRELMKQKAKILLVFISIVLAVICTTTAPMIVGTGINTIYQGVMNSINTGADFAINWQTMGNVILVLTILYLLNSLFTFVQQYVMSSVAQTLTLSYRTQISKKINLLPISYFDKHNRGDILSRVTSDLERVGESLQEGLTQLMSSVITIIAAFLMMIIISPTLTMIVFTTIILSFIAAGLISKYTQKAFSKNQAALGAYNGAIEEIFTGNLVVKSFDLKETMTEKTNQLNQDLFRTNKRAEFMMYVINPMVRLLNHVGYVVIAIRGAASVIGGSITIGDIQAFFQYVNQVSEPATQVSFIVNMFQGAIASAERVYEILDAAEEVEQQDSIPLSSSIEGEVVFKDVSFGYTPEKKLMENINLHVKAGSKIAIVGPTGAGKTTFVNLLMRFYEINGGSIEIDQVNISQMKRKELRSIIGMVLQDTWLFEGTFKENISYGKKDASSDEVLDVSKAARVDHFIRTMPDGYDTVISGDDSANISQGQKQLLTIARALLADPKILILDEATSSVDTRTEIEIQKAMNTLMKGRTTFVIAHRLSTIKDADLILVMNNGTIIEQGSHQELMKEQSFYSELYNSQFAS